MIHVSSEIGRLKKVIVHRPDDGISRISPKRAEELLFDDIVHLPLMQQEHQIFSDVLRAFVGNDNVYDTETLVKEALDASENLKTELIQEALEEQELPPSYISTFLAMDHEKLAEVLITGYDEENDHIYFDPIPNFIFTRDIAVVCNGHVLITKAAKEARQRENLLTRFIFLGHPLFDHLKDQDRIINLNKIEEFPPSKKGEIVSIEGGDMMVLSGKYLLIGCSERTTAHAFNSIKKALFEKNVIDNVVQVNIPADRSYMHIDTLFTRVSEDVMVCFKPIIYDGLGSNVEVHRKDGSLSYFPSIKDFLLEEINPKFRFVFAGGGESPYQEREQWTDGCNLVALKSGVGITYDRNLKTGEAFVQQGFEMMPADEFIKRASDNPNFSEQLENTIITIPSSELSRARGGSHCMTCPILRD